MLHMLPRRRPGTAKIEDQASPESVPSLKMPKEEPSISSSAAVLDLPSPLDPLEIDEELYWQQIAMYGIETMRKLVRSKVLISGLSGLGAEIAKNLFLVGIKSVTLHDDERVQLRDLSSNFLLSEDDFGKNRALACIPKLQGLNDAVSVSTLTDLNPSKLSDFQVVVFTDISLEKAIEYDDYCHKHEPPIAFIKAEVHGLFGNIFCDFGPEFTVVDVDGEEPCMGIIAFISNDNPAIVSCVDDERLEFQDGDLVVFSEVEGMTELNDGKLRRIKNASPHSFTLEEDTTSFGRYEKGGIVTQVKQPKVLKFKPLRDALRDPGEILLSGFSKFNQPQLSHLGFQALDKFRSDFGRFPAAGSKKDAEKLIALAVESNEDIESGGLPEIDTKLLHQFASGSGPVLIPMAAVLGGIVGEEVVKACSGKFHPLYQFFYFASVESLPVEPLEPGDFEPQNCRYDDQICVFGQKLQKNLEEAEVFVVGSGALGCEFLKNLALMGVCCSSEGKLTITDDDIIEKSDLSRQFLFRYWNVGQAKSTVAVSAAKCINPRLHIETLQKRASPETEDVFNDAFWDRLDVVISALGNAKARNYVNSRCLYFQKPHLESVSIGAKCETNVVIPHLTESYGPFGDPTEKLTPLCILDNFPYKIDHCMTWASHEFEDLFEKAPNEVNSFLSNLSECRSAFRVNSDLVFRARIDGIAECFVKERSVTFLDCVTWARLKFEDYFVNAVKQLTLIFPKNFLSVSNLPFWLPPRRFPEPLQFSSRDAAHLSFIMSASVLIAETFRIPIPDSFKNPSVLVDAVDKVVVPDLMPEQENSRVSYLEGSVSVNDTRKKLEKFAEKLPPGFRMKLVEFEKGDYKNYHMDFIAGLANLKARNYRIPEVDKQKAKIISGRIIPSIATSASVAGLLCLELYKVLAGGHSREDYHSSIANFAPPMLSMAEPFPPEVIKHGDVSWTAWDRWKINGDLTLREVLQWLQEEKGFQADSVCCGSHPIYSSRVASQSERLDRKVVDLARDIAQVEVPPYRNRLDMAVTFAYDDHSAGSDAPPFRIISGPLPRISMYFR